MNCATIQAEYATAMLTRSAPADEIASHIAGCVECSREAALLAPLPGLLSRLEGPTYPMAPADGPDLLEALLARAARARRGRRLSLAAAAAVLVLLAVGWLGISRPGEPTLAGAASGNGLSVAVVVAPVGSASRVSLTADGLPVGLTCRVDAVTDSGRHLAVLTWTVGYSGRGQLAAITPIVSGELSRIELVSATSGKLITTVALHRGG